MTTLRIVIAGALLPLCVLSAALAQPAPRGVDMADLGVSDPRLKGILAPRGIKVEIVSEIPGANPRDVLLVHEGWSYRLNGGRLVRRHEHDAALLKDYQAAAEAKTGPPTAATGDGKWIEQQLLQGLANKPGEATGGVMFGLDGWLYLSLGGMANRPESWDESKAAVLGSGAIFRFQPDGSRVQEFARGLAQPVGPPMCDALGVVFQMDRTPSGSRLIHVLAGGDYGWRSDLDPPQLDRPGTLPAMLASKDREPGSGMIYSGDAFPRFFQRLLIVPAKDTHAVRAIMLQQDGVTLAASAQFDLLRSDEGDFQPIQAIGGPDGAIYVTEKEGRILRLSWSGTKDAPAIPPATPGDRTAPVELARDELVATALDETKPIPNRAAALAAASRQWNGAVLDACLSLLEQKDSDLQRLAADALGDHLPDDVPTQQRMASAMQGRLLVASLPARRSLYIALGKLGTKLETVPEWIFEATSVTPDAQTNRWLFDGHVRAAEMPKGWATELLIGNLEVALFDPNPEPDERQRLKQFVVATASAMRTRELADFLDRLIRDEKDYFSKIEAPLQVRLLAAYRNVLVEPPVRADAVAEWMEKHPTATAEVQQAAGEILAKLGTQKPETLATVAKQLLSAKAGAALRKNIAAALERHRVKDKPGQIDELIAALRKP